MVRSHAGIGRLAALQAMSRGGNAMMFEAYTPCEFKIADQWFARIGCSELNVVLQQLEQVICEASRVANLNTNDVRWTSAVNIMETEASTWSHTAVVYPGNCAQYVDFVKTQTANVQAVMAEAGTPSKLAPVKITGGSVDVIPKELLYAGGIALGLAALYYAGPLIRGLVKK